MADKEFTDEELEAAFEPITDEELEAAFEPIEEPKVPGVKAPPGVTKQVLEGLGAGARGLAQGVTFGAAPAAETAAIEGVGKLIKGEKPVIPGTPEFRQKVLERVKPYQEAEKEYPMSYTAGQALGALAPGVGVSKAALGASKLAGGGLPGALAETAVEAGAGAGLGYLQGGDSEKEAYIAGGATVGGQVLGKLGKLGASALKQGAIEDIPTQYRGIAGKAAESKEALGELQSAGPKMRQLGREIEPLEKELKLKQSKEESQFEQARKAVEEANKIKQADYDAALKQEDITQKQLIKQTIEDIKKARSVDAANRLSESVNKGLKAQQQKAQAKYDIAYGQMNDQVDPKSSQIRKMRRMFKKIDPDLSFYAVDTNKILKGSSRQLKEDALTGAWTQGKEFKSLVEMDQAINADIRRLRKQQNRDFSPNVQRAIDQLETVKVQLDSRLNSAELGLEGDVLDQYNEAKSHYADFAKMRDELFEAKLLSPKRSISGVRKYEATAESAGRFLQPKVEDIETTAKVQDVMQRLPGGLEDTSAMTPAEFAQLRQQATGPVPTELLPQRPPSAVPKPELAEVPTQRAITPEEQALESQIAGKQGQIEELRPSQETYKELQTPTETSLPLPDFITSSFVKKPITRVKAAQLLDRLASTDAVKKAENETKGITTFIKNQLMGVPVTRWPSLLVRVYKISQEKADSIAQEYQRLLNEDENQQQNP